MKICPPTLVLLASILLASMIINPAISSAGEPPVDDGPDELIDDPYVAVPRAHRATSPGRRAVLGPYVSVQVNVDENGNNIVGDAANEPSLVIDPTNPQRMAIGWRQFDTIDSNFRQAGYGFTTNGGNTWTFPGAIDPGVFRSDPVLDTDADGTFFFNSLESDFTCDVFLSSDGGATWDSGSYALGGDKQWMSIDRNPGAGQGHIYIAWYPFIGCCFPNMFSRSTDVGMSFASPIAIGDGLRRGTTSIGPDSAVYVTGHLPTDSSSFAVAKSTTSMDPSASMTFDFVAPVDLGGSIARAVGPNPAGLLGQIWVVADPTDAGRVYLLSSIDPPGEDPLDVHFARSVDGGITWSPAVRVNDDPMDNGAWQWFGTLAVAANGRLDAVWNDTRDDPGGLHSVLYYASSEDSGVTWSTSKPVTPSWDPHLGFPQQNKIGDYYQMISFNDVVHIAYAATFNGEQDIYYLRLPLSLLFADGFESGNTATWSSRSSRAAGF